MAFVRSALRWPLWLIEAAPFFLLMGIFRLIGVDAASATGGFLARNLAPLSPAHGTARRNMARAMPNLSEAEVAKALNGMWDNLGRTFGEYPHFRRFTGFPNPRVEVLHADRAFAARDTGKGIVFVSGHFANWELMALTAFQAGFEGAEVYRPINNPIVNAWIVGQRRRYVTPVQVSKTGEGARTLLRVLKTGKMLAMLVDQKHREGVPVPFFGRDAMTVPGPAVLALRTSSTVLPVRMERTNGARFRMVVDPAIEMPRSGDTATDVMAGLNAINRWLEDAIRANPSMWLWAHDRWDDRPRKNRKPVRQEGMGGAAS
jgi:KDO2-lipid IV(A) lauroyltransferase